MNFLPNYLLVLARTKKRTLDSIATFVVYFRSPNSQVIGQCNKRERSSSRQDNWREVVPVRSFVYCAINLCICVSLCENADHVCTYNRNKINRPFRITSTAVDHFRYNCQSYVTLHRLSDRETDNARLRACAKRRAIIGSVKFYG